MSTLIGSFDGLHDNRVLCYCADFEAHTLHMDTQTESGEKVSVHFTGLLAHLCSPLGGGGGGVSSLGLCGFVLAKEVELQCQSLLIK